MTTFRAGCGRSRQGPDDLEDLAYTELSFPECPTCPHRLEPEGARPFCRWLASERPNPFARLSAFRDTLEEAE